MTLADVRWIDFPCHEDERGVLTAVDEGVLPFRIRRFFYMHRVPPGQERGGHAHRYTQQCIVTLAGRVMLDVSDGSRHETYELDDPNRGVYMPEMMWVRLHAFAPGTVALVLCDRPYNPAHVIRDWEQFLALTAVTPGGST